MSEKEKTTIKCAAIIVAFLVGCVAASIIGV